MQWYYGENGQQSGPVDEEQLNALIAAGRIGPSTLVWKEGMQNWWPLGQLRSPGDLYQGSAMQMGGYHMMNPTTSGLAIASMVCGIVGLISCFHIVGIAAVVCGHMALNQIANSRNLVVGRGMALSGIVCGYLSILIMVSFVILIVFSAVAGRP